MATPRSVKTFGRYRRPPLEATEFDLKVKVSTPQSNVFSLTLRSMRLGGRLILQPGDDAEYPVSRPRLGGPAVPAAGSRQRQEPTPCGTARLGDAAIDTGRSWSRRSSK
jgi:hypothetical protein